MRDALRHAVSRGGVGRTPGFILSLRLDSIGDKELLRGSKAEIKSAAAWRQSCRAVEEGLTWPGYTLRVKSLFSWTSLLGVMLNLSAMLLSESSAPTCEGEEAAGDCGFQGFFNPSF